jgi:uncharacterized membrane protein YraQ (UPF0718 family)
VDYAHLIRIFTGIIYEALPFIVLGVILAGLLEEFVPQQAIAKVLPSNPLIAILLGALLGIIFPMCECGIIVVMRRLLRKGLPLSVCVSYVLCGPVINVIVLTSTWVAFSRYPTFGGPWGMVLLRAGLAYVVAVVTALVVEWQFRIHGTRLLSPKVTRGLKDPQAEEKVAQAKRSGLQRINNITSTALNDFVDIMAFLILGAAIAAGGRLILAPSSHTAPPPASSTQDQAAGSVPKGQTPTAAEKLIKDNPPLAILLMMGMAVLFCLCSEADAFVAANFQPLWLWPPASKLAFLVLGPMFDLKLYLMYTRVFRTRLIFTIVLSVVVQVFVYCLLVHYFFGAEAPLPSSP